MKYEESITNLVMAEDLLKKAKRELYKGEELNIKGYNNALNYASKFILESRI